MEFLKRLLSGLEAKGAPRHKRVPLSLQLLFPGRLRLPPVVLERTLRGLHPSLAQARFELESHRGMLDATVGLVAWGRHRVRVVGFNAPMPAAVVEQCVTPAHYGAALKAQARTHASHALLFYVGEEKQLLEQYVALAVVAVALAAQGALVVLNESGHTSFPAQPLVPGEGEDMMELLRTMPLTALFVGFVKMELEGVPGVWMRTHGSYQLRLPDLAWHARGHEEGREVFERFSNLLDYVRASRARLAPGHTVELGEGLWRLRAPRKDEPFLQSPGELFVLERVESSRG
jgi:hypothetical protein